MCKVASRSCQHDLPATLHTLLDVFDTEVVVRYDFRPQIGRNLGSAQGHEFIAEDKSMCFNRSSIVTIDTIPIPSPSRSMEASGSRLAYFALSMPTIRTSPGIPTFMPGSVFIRRAVFRVAYRGWVNPTPSGGNSTCSCLLALSRPPGTE